MTADETENDWGDLAYTDSTDRRLVTDISGTFAYLSPKGRAKRRKQKLREELVRAHILQQIQAPSMLQSLVNKLTRSP